jgi:hypothetical protein
LEHGPVRWAIDLDDVTVDFIPGLLNSYKLEFGETIIPLGGTWGPEMENFLRKGTPKLRAAGYKSAWEWLRDREWLWANFPAVPGAIGGVSTLRASGHYVEAVTSKPDWAEHNVWKWLGKWRVPFNRVTIVDRTVRKVDATNADVIVDDKLQTCVQFAEEGRQAIWFTKTFDDPKLRGLHVASNWDEVLFIAEHLTKLEAVVCS